MPALCSGCAHPPVLPWPITHRLPSSQPLTPAPIPAQGGGKGKAGAKAAAPLGPKNAAGGKSVEETYQKLSQLEHVLLRPDTYIGSTERQQEKLWVHDGERMVLKTIEFVPGLYKIFDEILVNAADNKVRDPTMDMIKVRARGRWRLGPEQCAQATGCSAGQGTCLSSAPECCCACAVQLGARAVPVHNTDLPGPGGVACRWTLTRQVAGSRGVWHARADQRAAARCAWTAGLHTARAALCSRDCRAVIAAAAVCNSWRHSSGAAREAGRLALHLVGHSCSAPAPDGRSLTPAAAPVSQAKGTITVLNNGAGIPVEVHKVEKVYVPELIFGHLLTSSNYNDNEKKASRAPGLRAAGVAGGGAGTGTLAGGAQSHCWLISPVCTACGRKQGRAVPVLRSAPARLRSRPHPLKPHHPPCAGDRGTQRLRRQAGQHLLQEVCGGDVRRQAQAALQAGAGRV